MSKEEKVDLYGKMCGEGSEPPYAHLCTSGGALACRRHDKMSADDVIAVEQLAYFYEQAYGTGGHLYQIPALFCFSEEAGLHTHANRCGLEAIKAQYVEYYDGTPLYDTYHCGQQICTPVIEVDGDRSRGQFPTSSFFIHCCAGIPAHTLPDPPYAVNSTFELWFHDFLREHGLWKISDFHFAGLVSFGMLDPFWSWDPADDGMASRSLLHTLSTPFPIMDYLAEMARFETNKEETGGCGKNPSEKNRVEQAGMNRIEVKENEMQ